VLKPCGRYLIRKSRTRWEDNIKKNLWLWRWEADRPGLGSCQVEGLQSLNLHGGTWKNHALIGRDRLCSAWMSHGLQPSELLTQVASIVTCDCFCKRKEKNCDGFSLQKCHERRKWYIFSDIWNGFSFYEIRGFVILSQTSFFLDKHSYATCIYKVGVKTHEVMMQTLGLPILQHSRNLGQR
jgi:hypothetical protein